MPWKSINNAKGVEHQGGQGVAVSYQVIRKDHSDKLTSSWRPEKWGMKYRDTSERELQAERQEVQSPERAMPGFSRHSLEAGVVAEKAVERGQRRWGQNGMGAQGVAQRVWWRAMLSSLCLLHWALWGRSPFRLLWWNTTDQLAYKPQKFLSRSFVSVMLRSQCQHGWVRALSQVTDYSLCSLSPGGKGEALSIFYILFYFGIFYIL